MTHFADDRGSRVRRLAPLLLAGVTVLALIWAAVAWFTRPSPQPTGPVAGPSEVVREYLDALIAADSKKALAAALAPPPDRTWLTDEALAAARKAGGWSVVSVGEATGERPVQVPVVLDFETEKRSFNVAVVATPQGWKLPQVASQISLAGIGPQLPLALDGHDLGTQAAITVFPGWHHVASNLPEVDLGAKRVLIDALGQTVSVTPDLQVTADGRKRLQQLAQASLKKCLAAKSLTPAGCPNTAALKQGKPVTKSISWTLSGNPWKKAEYSVTDAAPTTVVGKTTISFHLKTPVKVKTSTYKVDEVVTYPVLFSADMATPKPVVSWQRTAK